MGFLGKKGDAPTTSKAPKAAKAPVVVPAGHPRAGLPALKWKLMLVAGALLSGINGTFMTICFSLGSSCRVLGFTATDFAMITED